MKKRMMNVLLAGVLAAGSISPAMAAMAEEADGKVLDIALSADISTMDVMGTSKDYMVPMNVFDRLKIWFPLPGLRSYRISVSRLLRKNIRIFILNFCRILCLPRMMRH